jgi:hypothetical protein
MSGYAGLGAPELNSSSAILLTKPFTRDALLQKLEEVLKLDLILT